MASCYLNAVLKHLPDAKKVLIINITLSESRDRTLSLTYTDDAGGFTERFLKQAITNINNDDKHARLEWLTDHAPSSKAGKFNFCFLGCHNLGPKQTLAMVLEGKELMGNGKYRQRFQFGTTPQTHVVLKILYT